jgi:hypothetical protein
MAINGFLCYRSATLLVRVSVRPPVSAPSVLFDVHTKDLNSSWKERPENPQTGTIRTYARWQTFLGTGFLKLKFYEDDIFPLQEMFYLAFRWVTRVLRGNITARNLK